jgi:hypothetical protein
MAVVILSYSSSFVKDLAVDIWQSFFILLFIVGVSLLDTKGI